MTRRSFCCAWCGAETEVETDNDWMIPKNWTLINRKLICPDHRRIQITHHKGVGKVVRYSPMPGD